MSVIHPDAESVVLKVRTGKKKEYAVGHGHHSRGRRLVAGTEEFATTSREALESMFQSIKNGDVEALTQQLKEHPQAVEVCSEKGDSLLHTAIREENDAIVGLLLAAGCNPDQRNNEGEPPLLMAVRLRRNYALELLLEAGAEPGIEWNADSKRRTPLYLACQMENEAAVELLLSCGRLTLNDINYLVDRGDKVKFAATEVSLTQSRSLMMTMGHHAMSTMRLNQSFADLKCMMGKKEAEEGADDSDSDDESESGKTPNGDPGLDNVIDTETNEVTALDELDFTRHWQTIYELTTNDAIRRLLAAYGATESNNYIAEWLAAHANRSMNAFCRDLPFMPGKPNPIILVPGLCSSVLECWASKTKPEWVGERLWLSVRRMGLPSSLKRVQGKVGVSNAWLDHLMLAEDGFSDPEGIRVRAAQGLHAVDYLCSAVGKDSSYVLAHLIRAFQASGFTPRNLTAFTYDWRLPPQKLQERDSAFTCLQSQIELYVHMNGRGVVLLGHSMGNKLIHYFLFWAEQTLGRDWIDHHVRCFMAVGSPWIGAAKAIRSLNTGEAMGLEVFLSYAETLAMSRSYGSAGWLMPEDMEAWKKTGLESVIYRSESGGTAPMPVPWTELLDDCLKHKTIREQLYMKDELYGSTLPGHDVPTMLRPPPVKELVCVYGTNVPTEVAYVLKKLPKPTFNSYGEQVIVKLDRSKKRGNAVVAGKGNLRAKSGIIYEVPFTKEDGEEVPSGDGTVPYASLTYYKKWYNMEGAPKIRTVQVRGAEHREMLNMPIVIGPLLNFLSNMED